MRSLTIAQIVRHTGAPLLLLLLLLSLVDRTPWHRDRRAVRTADSIVHRVHHVQHAEAGGRRGSVRTEAVTAGRLPHLQLSVQGDAVLEWNGRVSI